MMQRPAAGLILLSVAAIAAAGPALTLQQNGGLSGQSESATTPYSQHRSSRVNRQIPGTDFIGQIGEAFQNQLQQKQERMMDFVDQVGQVLGGLGDSIRQTMSDMLGGDVPQQGSGGGSDNGGGKRGMARPTNSTTPQK